PQMPSPKLVGTARYTWWNLVSRASRSIRETRRHSVEGQCGFILVEFPAPGMWLRVFNRYLDHLTQTEHISAFMPCTPNPTTGFFYVPRKGVIDRDITVEQAMTVIMSAGMIQPVSAATSRKSSPRWRIWRASRATAARSRPRRRSRGTAVPRVHPTYFYYFYFCLLLQIRNSRNSCSVCSVDRMAVRSFINCLKSAS